MSFLQPYFYFIALSFIVSLFAYKDFRYPYLKWLPPFLFLTLIIEFVASYINGVKGDPNTAIYNLFSVFEFCFYLFLISLIIRNAKAKKIIAFASLFYAFVSLGNIFFFQGINHFHTVTYSLGCLMIVAACIYFFLELFRLPRAVKLSVDPAFWICSGLLFFYCCGFPLYAFLNFWAQFEWVVTNFQKIVAILNIFLYSLFIIAFLCHKTRKYTSSS